MTPNTTFEIRRSIGGWQMSGVYDAAALRGTPLGAHATDPTKFVLAGTASDPAATGSNFLGFLERDCTAAGPTLADHIYPGRLELPYKAGTEVSIIKAAEVEAEGTDRINVGSGTGQLNGSTVVGTKVSFRAGKFSAWVANETAYFTVSANNLEASDGTSLRMRFEMIGA